MAYGFTDRKEKADVVSKNEILNLIYPVGSIYMSTKNTDPASIFGGTWERITGKVLVGVNESDSDFSTVNKTGGSKTHVHTTQAHTLTIAQIPSHSHATSNTAYNFALAKSSVKASGFTVPSGVAQNTTFSSTDGTSSFTTSANTGNAGLNQSHSHGDTGASSNLMPYQTVYMWERTA